MNRARRRGGLLIGAPRSSCRASSTEPLASALCTTKKTEASDRRKEAGGRTKRSARRRGGRRGSRRCGARTTAAAASGVRRESPRLCLCESPVPTVRRRSWCVRACLTLRPRRRRPFAFIFPFPACSFHALSSCLILLQTATMANRLPITGEKSPTRVACWRQTPLSFSMNLLPLCDVSRPLSMPLQTLQGN